MFVCQSLILKCSEVFSQEHRCPISNSLFRSGVSRSNIISFSQFWNESDKKTLFVILSTQPGWSPQEKCESQLWTRPSSHRHNQLRRPGPRLHKVSFSIISGIDWTEIVYCRLQSVCDDCGERRPRAARRGRNPSASIHMINNWWYWYCIWTSIHMISTDNIDIEYWWCQYMGCNDKY